VALGIATPVLTGWTGEVFLFRRGSGVKDSIKVALPRAASSVGNFNGPFWPQPTKATVQSTRHWRVTKIKQTFNMHRIVMTDLEFLTQAEHLLSAVEQSCDRINDETEADVDNQRSGGMITLSFANRSQIILNLQKPLHEVWMAAKSGGYHYKWVEGAWQDTKGQGEFFANLTRYASEQAGLPLKFTA
jgi:CyaY protein